MPSPHPIPTGAPCWIDLFTSDPDKAKAFYGELFGWTSEDAGEEFGHYINFSKDGKRVAGGMRNDGSQGAPDFWTLYLGSDDAKATVDAAAASGGQTYLEAMDVMGLGTMAMVADPGGAAIGIWQPGTHAGFETWAEPGTPGWFELHTRDHDGAVAFYRDVFGWPVHAAADEPGFRYTTYGEGETMRAGIYDASAWPDDPVMWSIYFTVDDADATAAKAVELGGTVVDQPEDSPYGRLATVTDPTGVRFKLIQQLSQS